MTGRELCVGADVHLGACSLAKGGREAPRTAELATERSN